MRNGVVVADEGGGHFGGQFKHDILSVLRAVADTPFFPDVLVVFEHTFVISHRPVEDAGRCVDIPDKQNVLVSFFYKVFCDFIAAQIVVHVHAVRIDLGIVEISKDNVA